MDILVVYNNHIFNALINSLLSAYVLRVIKKCVACFKKMY